MHTSKSLLLAAVISVAAFLLGTLAQDHSTPATPGAFEYVTIRWDGRDNTHLIRPGGKVEFLGPELRKLVKPDHADNRAFYMNAAMNGLVKEGYEFAGMSSDEIVMKRPRTR